MRKSTCFLTFLLPILFSNQLSAQKDSTHFVTKWHAYDYPTYDSSMTILTDTNYAYNYDIDWENDGVFDTLGVQGNATHYYSLGDTVSIRIRGNYPRIVIKNKQKLLTVTQWGTTYWKDMSNAFAHCRSLRQFEATDLPRLDSVRNMSRMFYNARNFKDSIINQWDVSAVENMSEMFMHTDSFSVSLNAWDVSSVRNMKSMFAQSKFNSAIDSWDVSSVTNMEGMFNSPFNDFSPFNQAIGNWDVSSVTTMESMFEGARSFNQPIGNWDVSSVTTMERMFEWADSFNQPIGNWDVSSVTTMERMFYYADSFNQPIGNWDVSSVTTMYRLFRSARSFNQLIGNWDVSSVTTMERMFAGAISFNQPIGNWDVSSVTTMHRMFRGAASFNQSIGTWDVSAVTDMGDMFYNAFSFNGQIDSWDVSSVTSMSLMFYQAYSFNQPLSSWDVSSVTNMGAMFFNASHFDQNLSNWDISTLYNMGNLFNNSGLSIQNYDSILIAWQSKPHQSGVVFGGAGLEYCLGDSARQQLINQSSWQFSGDTKNCTTVGLNEAKQNDNNFSVYPIPSQGVVTVEVQKVNANDLLRIYNARGMLVQELRLNSGANKVDLSNYADGLYLFRLGVKEEKVLLSR